MRKNYYIRRSVGLDLVVATRVSLIAARENRSFESVMRILIVEALASRDKSESKKHQVNLPKSWGAGGDCS